MTASLVAFALALAAPKGLTLTGTVADPAGRPVPNATIFVRTAGPRQGVGVLCPSCYPDCDKTAVTDGTGRFALAGLDPALVFRLLVVADGFTPALSPAPADPKAGPVSFALKPHDLDSREAARVFRGRVLNEVGRPVAGAVVEPFGYRKGDRGKLGTLDGFDPLAVSDEKGEFRLGVAEAGVELYVRVSAPFLATRAFQRVPAGDKPAELTLTRGVTVRGRVVKDGAAVPGAAVGLCQKNRSAQTFVGAFQVATNAKGVFELPNVPPDEVFALYGLMAGLRPHGAVKTRDARTGATGTRLDVGDLEVTAGHRLTGRVVLSDGRPVPAGTRVLLSREEAWDTQQAAAGPDGGFAFDGLPAERYSLYTAVKGYHLSPRNASRDVFNTHLLAGSIKGDVEGLRVLLEPGPLPEPAPPEKANLEEAVRRREAPLRGAPAPPPDR